MSETSGSDAGFDPSDQAVREAINNFIQERAREAELVSREEYWRWVEHKTADSTRLNSHMYDYDSEVSPEDKERADLVAPFVLQVLDHAEANYTVIHEEEWHGRKAFFTYHDVDYSAGVLYGQGSYYYVERLAPGSAPESKADAPDLESVFGGVKTEAAEVIDQQLAELGDYAQQLLEAGVPRHALAETIGDVLANERVRTDRHTLPSQVGMPTSYGFYAPEIVDAATDAMRELGFRQGRSGDLWGSDVARVIQAAVRAQARLRLGAPSTEEQ